MPEKENPSEDEIKKVMSYLGKKGGSAKSEKKKKSSAENLRKAHAEGKRGGRPRKRDDSVPWAIDPKDNAIEKLSEICTQTRTKKE